MGSGISSSYSGKKGASHPYAESYHVEKSMHQQDIDYDIYNGTSEKNPTAKKLTDMITAITLETKTLTKMVFPT